ncbi:hypothetical protein Daesc_002309 [Daldinia eschscholtzii]|uniref:Nucleolar protein 16 n=1 Tax=Daldinia eschscholtzii TaxID=292717 RepID=A0AAX6MWZ5_9PEZI
MAPTAPPSEGDKRKESGSKDRSPSQNSEGIKRRQKAHALKRLALKYKNAPNGTRLGLQWDPVLGKKVAYIKDHFTGAIRPAIMKDNMYDNMSKEKLEWHRQQYLQAREALENEDEGEEEKDEG